MRRKYEWAAAAGVPSIYINDNFGRAPGIVSNTPADNDHAL
jgi:hypothetical protein